MDYEIIKLPGAGISKRRRGPKKRYSIGSRQVSFVTRDGKKVSFTARNNMNNRIRRTQRGGFSFKSLRSGFKKILKPALKVGGPIALKFLEKQLKKYTDDESK